MMCDQPEIKVDWAKQQTSLAGQSSRRTRRITNTREIDTFSRQEKAPHQLTAHGQRPKIRQAINAVQGPE
ncbi:unnamed protein product [Parajaminaea phylloscopi]